MKKLRALIVLFVSVTCLAVPRADACTIFVLTGTNHALFCNNEDWSNPKTRIWFVPAGTNHFGCAYVGFDNGFAQGGLNTKGLAFDWVAGGKVNWEPDPATKPARGNASERMLESCANVEDAIAFYRKYREPGFSYAKILVADRTGNSVIIGAKDGKTAFEKATTCRGFGYGGRTLDEKLAAPPEPTMANGAAILRACLQEGQYATKYSDIFDLKSGDIFLFQFPEHPDEVKLNLANELEKGGHYYDIPDIREQLNQPPILLLNNMKRFFMDQFQPIPDKEPTTTKLIQALIQDMAHGAMQADNYTAEFLKELSAKRQEVQSQLAPLGDFESLTLVGREGESDKRSYRYRAEFKEATVLLRFVLNHENKVVLFAPEGAEQKLTSDEKTMSADLPPRVHNRQVISFTEGARKGLRFDERSGDGVAWWPEKEFANGTIEFDVRGKDVFQKSFVGVAFHGVDEKTCDVVYFRPFNFRASDPARQSHSVQYVSLPAYDWQKLRTEHPGKYENAVQPAPAPDQWFHARIVVAHPKVSVFVNEATEPCLVIERLSDRKGGWIGFWVGNGSGGDFANLKITALNQTSEITKP